MVTFLLKKSYQLSNLKEVTFKDLWGSRGVFTTMRMVGKPPKLILLKPHVENLIKSTKKYGIRKKNLKLLKKVQSILITQQHQQQLLEKFMNMLRKMDLVH